MSGAQTEKQTLKSVCYKLRIKGFQQSTVNSQLSRVSLIFQYPLRASKVEKHLEPLSLGRTSSNVGVKLCGLLIVRSVGSRQSRNTPVRIVTHTRELIVAQSVGSVTFAWIFYPTNKSSSFFKGSLWDSGTLRWECKTGGTVESTVILYSPGK